MMKALKRLLLNEHTQWTTGMQQRIENLFDWHSRLGNKRRALRLLKAIPACALEATALVNTQPTTYPYVVSPMAAKLLNNLPLSPAFEFGDAMRDCLNSQALNADDVQRELMYCLKASSPRHTHPALHMARVPEDDPRKALRGQRAVYTNATLPRGTYLGTYSGALTTTGEYNRWFPHSSVGEQMHAIYALLADSGELVPGADDDDNELCIYPLGGTDLLHMVNDARMNPFHPNLQKRHDKEGENAAFVSFRWMKGLYMGLIAMADIAVGEEIKIDYGPAYWS